MQPAKKRPILMIAAAVLLVLSALLLYGRLKSKPEPEVIAPPAVEQTAPTSGDQSQRTPETGGQPQAAPATGEGTAPAVAEPQEAPAVEKSGSWDPEIMPEAPAENASAKRKAPPDRPRSQSLHAARKRASLRLHLSSYRSDRTRRLRSRRASCSPSTSLRPLRRAPAQSLPSRACCCPPRRLGRWRCARPPRAATQPRNLSWRFAISRVTTPPRRCAGSSARQARGSRPRNIASARCMSAARAWPRISGARAPGTNPRPRRATSRPCTVSPSLRAPATAALPTMHSPQNGTAKRPPTVFPTASSISASWQSTGSGRSRMSPRPINGSRSRRRRATMRPRSAAR